MKQNVTIGPVTFWPWNPSEIHDADVKNQLEHFFKIFVDHHGNAVDTITICSHGDRDFRVMEEKDFNEQQAAINILVFSSICPEVKASVKRLKEHFGKWIEPEQEQKQ